MTSFGFHVIILQKQKLTHICRKSKTLKFFTQFSLCSFKNTSRPIYRTLGKSSSIYSVNIRFCLSHFSPDFASDLTVWCIQNAFRSFLIYILILLDFCIFLFVFLFYIFISISVETKRFHFSEIFKAFYEYNADSISKFLQLKFSMSNFSYFRN